MTALISFITTYAFALCTGFILANAMNGVFYVILNSTREGDNTIKTLFWSIANWFSLALALTLFFYGLTFYDGTQTAGILNDVRHHFITDAAYNKAFGTLSSLSVLCFSMSGFLLITMFVRDAKLTASEFSSDFGSFLGCLIMSPLLTVKALF